MNTIPASIPDGEEPGYQMKKIMLWGGLAAFIAGCSQQENKLKQQVAENYARIVYATYDDALIQAQKLQEAIDIFTANPTAASLDNARKAWLDSRPAYLQSEAFRFYDGPIDGEDGLEGWLNAWPLDENFIDYVQDPSTGKPIYGGVINNPADFPAITQELLVSENETHGETDVKLGYHAIEFLLWGQDLYADGPGRRAHTDYLTGADATAPHGERRKAYLKTVAGLLVSHLKTTRDAWAPDSGYRREFLGSAQIPASLTKILSGLGKLSKGELAGERMTVALENKDQEDEHSCFSDNTHQDIIYNQLGMLNVFTGSYTRTDGTLISGPGFYDLAASYNQEKADQTKAHMEQVLEACRQIPVPFDQAIIHDAPRVQEAIRLLRRQADEIQQVASLIGLTLVIPETNE